MRRIERIKKALIVLLPALLFVGCQQVFKHDESATINLLINDADMTSTSVTGKELMWGKSQIKWKDSTGRVQFKAQIQESDLLVIKSKNSYKYLICYLEEGQDLNVIYEAHQYKIIGNSIAARQNRLLIDISRIRKMLLSPQKSLPVKDKEIAQKAFDDIEQLITEFQTENADASPQFIEFVRFDNKYAHMNSVLADTTFVVNKEGEPTKQAQQIYQSVLEDSDFKNAYFSMYYRNFLRRTLGFIRRNDEDYKSELTTNPVLNEWHLASKLKSPELQEYQMAVSIKALFPVDCDLNIKHEINRYTGYWKKFLQEEYKSYLSRQSIRHGWSKTILRNPNLMMTSDDDEDLALADYHGQWVLLAIGPSDSGYSQYEANYLDKINEDLKELKCFCFIESNMLQSEREYNHIHWVFNTEEELKKNLHTDHLPSSLLINPEGEVELINLPNPSSGMLEPLLRKLMETGTY